MATPLIRFIPYPKQTSGFYTKKTYSGDPSFDISYAYQAHKIDDLNNDGTNEIAILKPFSQYSKDNTNCESCSVVDIFDPIKEYFGPSRYLMF